MKKLTLFLAVLFCTAAFGQNIPKVAVYVTGNVPENDKRVLGSRMLTSLASTGLYSGVERPSAFFAEAEQKRTTEHDGTIDDSQLSELGKQFSVNYVCIANVTPAFGIFLVEARIIDVETVETVFAGEINSPLKTADELTQTLETMIKNMFGELVVPVPVPEPVPESVVQVTVQAVAAPVPAPIVVPQTAVPEPAATTAPVMENANADTSAVRQPKNAISLRVATGEGFLTTEAYMRMDLESQNRRVYMGIGWGSANGTVSVNGTSINVAYRGNEYYLVGFYEWWHASKSGLFNVYGGLGGVLGYYNYKYHYAGIHIDNVSGPGLDASAQGGAGLKLGPVILGVDMRLATYARVWNYEDTGFEIKGGFAYSIGTSAGISYGTKK